MDDEAGICEGQRDPLYYFRSVTFLVEGSLFKVPRLYFEKNSSIFSDMFGLPAADNQEGCSDKNPIKLESVLKIDFQRLLAAMFPDLSRYIERPVNMGRKEWTSVLKLATMWQFGELRQEALDELSQIDIGPVDRLVLAKTYKVEKWLVDGYVELVQRDDVLSSEEKTKLGYETSLRIYEKREDTFKHTLSQPHYSTFYFTADGRYTNRRQFHNLEAEIRELFQDELADVKYGEIVEESTSGKRVQPQRKVNKRRKKYN